MKNRNKQFGLRADIEVYPNKEKGVVFARYTLYSFRFGIEAVGEGKAKLMPGDEWNERTGRAGAITRAKKNALKKYFHELANIYDSVDSELEYINESYVYCNEVIDSIKNGTFGQAKGSV